MSTLETARLSREDFVSWLAKALSGNPAPNAIDGMGPKKSTDITLAWVRQAGSCPLICVPETQIKDFFAFVSTYTKARPFSAFFRVLPLELVSVLRTSRDSETKRSVLAKCVAGAAMAETWVALGREIDRPKNVFPLLLSSLSATLGRVVLAKYDQAAFDWALQEWTELQSTSGNIFQHQELDAISFPWRLLLSTAATSPKPSSDAIGLITSFWSEALTRGAVQPEMLQLLSPLSKHIDLQELLKSSREERIKRFNEVVSDLKIRSERSAEAAFLAGLMLAIAGNGSFDLLRSARQFDGWLDSAVVWFGLCAALFEEGNILTYANSSGRRLMRDIYQFDDPFAPPRPDIASSEFRFIFSSGALSEIITHAPGSIDVEILPNVVTRVAGAASVDVDRRRNENDILLRSLDDAGYLIDRARKIAVGVDRYEGQRSSLKSPRRAKSR